MSHLGSIPETAGRRHLSSHRGGMLVACRHDHLSSRQNHPFRQWHTSPMVPALINHVGALWVLKSRIATRIPNPDFT